MGRLVMERAFRLTATSIAAVLIMAVSCIKESSIEGTGGTIQFGVSAVYENGPATKTEYSGKDQNNNSITSSSTAERIDWLSTDKIRILCSQASLVSGEDHYADYSITPGSISGQKQSASIAPVSEDGGLQWGTGAHNFYALYPSKVQNTNATIAINGTGATVTGLIPTSQSVTLSGRVFKPVMDYAYMYAIAPGVTPGSSVSLDFKPLVTALEFTLLTKSGDAITSKLTSVVLSSTQSSAYLAGSFTAGLTTTGLTSLTTSNITNGSNSITISLPGGGVQLSTTDAYTVTFLTLPMSQTSLTLTLNFANGTKRTLELKNGNAWVTVDACKKSYIWKLDAPLTVGTFVFSVTNPSDLVYSGGTSTTGNVVSYRYTKGSDVAANRFNVAWSIEGYYPTAADAAAGTNKYSGIGSTFLTSFSPSSTSGGYSGNTVSISYGASPGTNTTVDMATDITAKLTSNSGAYVRRGTSSSYWNLANPSSGSRTSISETANTYIVNAPGYYCIPLVMGNGIKNSTFNTVAWQQTNFVNYKGTSITSAASPLLQDTGSTPTKAFIVWEEADMVALSDKTNWFLDSGCITSSNVTIGGSSKTIYWLKFQITNDIKQGCIILAVTDGTDVMWSWTIWVTDYIPQDGRSGYNSGSSLADVTCTYDSSGSQVTFMPRNLGWVEGGSTTGTHYNQRSVFVRLKQTGTTNYVVMNVTQPETSVVTGGSAGHHPYYQWGRKDALMPSNGTGQTLLSPLYGKYTSFLSTNAKQTLATAIKNPQRYYGYGSGSTDWCSTSYNGWWRAGNTATAADKVTVKTIYDPCPAGYTVPRFNAFLGFRLGTSGTSPNASGSFVKGYYFWTGYRANASASTSGMKTIFFPASGGYIEGALSGVNAASNCWAAVPSNAYNGYTFGFDSFAANPQVNYIRYRSNGYAVRPSREQ